MDFDENGYIDQTELEKIMIATNDCYSFEKGAKKDAEKLMKNLDSKHIGKISKEQFISIMMNDQKFEEFHKRFNLDAHKAVDESYAESGKRQLHLGDLIKD